MIIPGSRLTAVGFKALHSNTTGTNNVAVGCEYSVKWCSRFNTEGTNNVMG